MYSRMRSRMIKFAIIILVIEILLVGVFCCGRWGWKLLGFRVCDGAHIETATVKEDSVRIQGVDPSIPPDGFLGYVYEEAEGTLYLGVQFSDLFGIFETGTFDITVPVEGKITQVCLRTADNDYTIWSLEEGLVAED